MEERTTIIALDALDRRLLEHLQGEASETNQALAERMNISPATCLRRVRWLEEQGFIERRVALLGAKACGPTLTALVEVSLDRQGAEHLDAFEAHALTEASVQQCYRVSPGPDFMLVVQVVDMPAYQALVQRLFTQDANVRNVKTFFSLKRARFSTRSLLAPA